MGWSYIPRWKFTDSCGRPRVPGAIHVGCAHDDQMQCAHASRRAFLKAGVAIVGGAGMATVVDPREVFAQVRVFPPPPPAVSPIAGLMDTHVHAAPDVFGRSLDDEEVAILYRERGLEALVLKNHVVATADRAWFARKHVAGIKVFGGIVLNSAVGGINPDAVNWMWRMQGGYGRVVWFPTFDADNHVKHFKDAPEGIKVLDADGKVLPAVRDVLKVAPSRSSSSRPGTCRRARRSPSSRPAAMRRRPHGRHPRAVRGRQHEPRADEEGRLDGRQAGAVRDGPADGSGGASGMDAPLAPREGRGDRRAVKEVGAQNFVLATDLGQTGNPSPAD